MKKYQVIYADPPWRYDFCKSYTRRIENQYPTMTVDELCDMDIPIDDNAVLYMWATAPKLLEAIKVMECWGFDYKTHAIWDKEKIGMGYWFRGQHELLLVGVKGKFSPPKSSVRVGSVFREIRMKHSKKPSNIRYLIKKWFPKENKLELFARERYNGWDVFGNEVLPDVDIEAESEQEPRKSPAEVFSEDF